MSEITREQALAHFGVKGMKWGVRRNTPDSSGVSRSQARTEIKTQNRQSKRRLEDFERSPNRSDQIRKARENDFSSKRKYEDVKREIKEKRGSGEIGKNAAKVALNKNGNERFENIYKADSQTTGEQMVSLLLGTVAPRKYA